MDANVNLDIIKPITWMEIYVSSCDEIFIKYIIILWLLNVQKS